MGKDVTNGYCLVTPMFEGIGLDGIDVQCIKPIGDSVPTDGSLNFQVLNTSRKMVKSFSYYGADAGFEGELVGWYDDDGEFAAPDAYTFKPGDAIMLYSPSDGIALQVAGQVPDKDAVVAILSAGYYLVGNSMPVDVDVQGLKVSEGVPTDGSLNFQVLNASRKMAKSFSYYGEDAGFEGELVGWYDDDGEFAAPDTYAIKPGSAVMLYAPAAMTITISAPAI